MKNKEEIIFDDQGEDIEDFLPQDLIFTLNIVNDKVLFLDQNNIVKVE